MSQASSLQEFCSRGYRQLQRRSWLNPNVASGGVGDVQICARQLIEKTLEHEDTLYLTFVDLRKAYDSVP